MRMSRRRVDPNLSVALLGTRGIPANHGGFETAAQEVSEYLARAGWNVTVYCQLDGRGAIKEDTFGLSRRVLIPVPGDGWLSTIRFDARALLHAIRRDYSVHLTFGYNTAFLNVLDVLARRPSVINMDGLEWARPRWSRLQRLGLRVNEWLAGILGTELIADHPVIAQSLERVAPHAKINMVPYGAYRHQVATMDKLKEFSLAEESYFLVVARPVPDNSILEIVRAFAAHPSQTLVLVGRYRDSEPYENQVLQAATPNVQFLGAIYDQEALFELRAGALGYIHGHTVGGTNPSLVEALAAGNAVIAHDNVFNRWVASGAGLYFKSGQELARHVAALSESPELVRDLGAKALQRWRAEFSWDVIGDEYNAVLLKALQSRSRLSLRRMNPREKLADSA